MHAPTCQNTFGFQSFRIGRHVGSVNNASTADACKLTYSLSWHGVVTTGCNECYQEFITQGCATALAQHEAEFQHYMIMNEITTSYMHLASRASVTFANFNPAPRVTWYKITYSHLADLICQSKFSFYFHTFAWWTLWSRKHEQVPVIHGSKTNIVYIHTSFSRERHIHLAVLW